MADLRPLYCFRGVPGGRPLGIGSTASRGSARDVKRIKTKANELKIKNTYKKRCIYVAHGLSGSNTSKNVSLRTCGITYN